MYSSVVIDIIRIFVSGKPLTKLQNNMLKSVVNNILCKNTR